MGCTCLHWTVQCLLLRLRTTLTLLSLLTRLTQVILLSLFYFDCYGHQEYKNVVNDGLWELPLLTLVTRLALFRPLTPLALTQSMNTLFFFYCWGYQELKNVAHHGLWELYIELLRMGWDWTGRWFGHTF